MSSAHHLHVISMVPDVVPIDTGNPQAVSIVPDVVPIVRGHPQVVSMVSDVVPIDRGHPTLFPLACECCLHIISMATYVVPRDWG